MDQTIEGAMGIYLNQEFQQMPIFKYISKQH